MKLYVARHTQTNYNVEHLCNADPSVDVHLTDLGIQQAKELAKKLSGITFDVIYLSELPRTKETASYLQQYSDTPIIVDSRLNDNATGFESKPTSEYIAAFNSSPDKWHTKFNDGESLAEARDRVEAFVKELRTKDYSSVLLVTHGYIIESIYAYFNGLDFDLAATFYVSQGDYLEFDLP